MARARRSGARNARAFVVALCLRGAVAAASTLGTPISIPPSQYWEGNDGPWATFGIQVGTPPQNIGLLPGSGQSSTTVVDVASCQSYPNGTLVNSLCPQSRGRTFNASSSSTYDAVTESGGVFNVGLYWEKNLGLQAAATYGFDTITLGWPGSGLPAISHQVIGAVQTSRYYLGTLALNPRPVNFTDLNDPKPSLLHTLKNNHSDPIPSTTWSYTAGCYNHVPKVYGSLVLGGYDNSYFVPNNVSFDFNQDISTDFMVAVQSVMTSASTSPLLSTGLYALISTIVPDLWLPLEACRAFEDAFGITYDNNTGLYVINDTLHKTLLEKDPTVTLRIGPQLDSDFVEIVMRYWSLYLTAEPPKVTQSTRYFPLRRASNETQYTLGRAFLQSAHISVDFDRLKFNVSQALYPNSSTESQIVAILPPVTITNSTESSSDLEHSSLSAGAIAGIVVGAIAAIAILIAGAFLAFRNKQRKRESGHFDPRFDKAELDTTAPTNPALKKGNETELEAADAGRYEVEADVFRPEMDAQEVKVSELGGETQHIYELPAGDIILPELESPSTAQVDRKTS